MLFRRATVVLAILLSTIPLPVLAEFCSGKYASTFEMVDAAFEKYGTLYTGGDYSIRHSDVAATLDLYRLWRGLPDVRFRDHEEPGYDYFENRPDPRENLDRRLALVESEDAGGEDNKERNQISVELDLAMALVIPRDGWDRSPDYALYDWLQMTMIASDAPWALAAHLSTPIDSRFSAYEKLRIESQQHYSNSKGLEWAVAAQLLTPPGEDLRALDELFSRWQEKVLNCQASLGEYAAWASTAANRMLLPTDAVMAAIRKPEIVNALPKSIAGVIAKSLAYQAVLHSDKVPLTMLIELANRSSTPALTAWIGVAGTYRSASIEELSQVHNGKPVGTYSIRAFNLLSVTDMTKLWRTTDLPADLHSAMLATIFARNVTLGRDEDAYALLTALKKSFPEHSNRVSEIDSLWIPIKVKLALITLDNPLISNWLKSEKSPGGDYNLWIRNTHESRDLPQDLASGVGVQSDYETWLDLPDRWSRSQYLWGTDGRTARIRWSETRLVPLQPPGSYVLIPKAGTHTAQVDFSNLIAWEELSKLTPGHGLTHAISQGIVSWAGEESNSWFQRLLGHRSEASDALRQIVLLNRVNDGGKLGDIPAGKAAFKLLQSGFANTSAAKQTRYWYRSHCESQMNDSGGCWHYSKPESFSTERKML